MNRRSFLRLLGLAAPALALDPERALWVPGKKTIFLPTVKPIGLAFHSDAFAFVMKDIKFEEFTRRYVTAAAAELAQRIDEQGAIQIGYTVNVRLPQRYRIGLPVRPNLACRVLG